MAQAFAAFGIAGMTSVCAAYGRAMNYDLVPVDSGTYDTDTEWTLERDGWPVVAPDATADGARDAADSDARTEVDADAD